MKNLFTRLALAAALCSLLISIQPILAQGTAFTYQGQLGSNGVPLNGNYDFEFSMYPNAAGTGSPLGTGTATQTAIGVSNGLFTTTLNFGAVFTGNATWLAISVRSNGVPPYTAMTPLQELTPTPYAIYTPNAGSAATATTAGTASSVAAANITGTVSLAQLPAAVVTNTETGVTLGGAFSGNGAGLTLLNAGNLSNGTVPLAQLSGITSNQLAVATWQAATNLNGGNATLASNVLSGISITNAFLTNAIITNSVFAGNGGGLSNLNASQMASIANPGGADNFFVGPAANASILGTFNTALGNSAFSADTTGGNDTATGDNALASNLSGNQNTANGSGTLQLNKTGSGTRPVALMRFEMPRPAPRTRPLEPMRL
jgi:hypothetical protein